MSLPSRSISVRLVFWLFLWTTVVMVSVGGILYHGIGKMLMSSVDRTLHSKLQIITGLLHEENGKVVLELSEIIAGEYVIPRSGHYYKVMAGNDLLAASPSLANDDFDFSVPPNAASANRLGESTFTGTAPQGNRCACFATSMRRSGKPLLLSWVKVWQTVTGASPPTKVFCSSSCP